jgi:hypothetical protein
MFDVSRFTIIKDSDIFSQAMDSSIYINYFGTKFYLYEGGVWADRVRDESIHSDQVVSLGLAAMSGSPNSGSIGVSSGLTAKGSGGISTSYSSGGDIIAMGGLPPNIFICDQGPGRYLKSDGWLIPPPEGWDFCQPKKRGSEKIEIFIKK